MQVMIISDISVLVEKSMISEIVTSWNVGCRVLSSTE